MDTEKFQQAMNLFEAGDKERAAVLLLEVVESDSANADAWLTLALCTDDMEKKKYFLAKVLEINLQHPKAPQPAKKIDATNSAKLPDAATLESVRSNYDREKTDAANHTNSPIGSKETNFSTANIITSVMIGLLVLCVAWLFYKVSKLEKSLVQTQDVLASTQIKLERTQSDLRTTRSTLITAIGTLDYVQGLAENANRYAHSHNNFSDSRLKKDITEIKDPLNGILSLNGVEFFWNTSKYPELGLNNDPQIGFIAQDLEQVYPQLVTTDENGFKTVDYVKLVPVLVEAANNSN